METVSILHFVKSPGFRLTCECVTQCNSPEKAVSLCVHAVSSYSGVRGFYQILHSSHKHMHKHAPASTRAQIGLQDEEVCGS